jgi:small subunit ribosomal protein S18
MQEKIEKEILKSQNVGLMGFYTKDVSFLKDPRLFDPERPVRPHKY